MAFSISFQTACLAFFFLQGLLFSGLLMARGKEYNHVPSYWLSLFIFLCSCCLVPFMMGYSGWYGKEGYREFLLFVPFQQFFLIGPVIYGYTKSLLGEDFNLRGKDRWHFLPGVLYLLYSLVVFITDVWVMNGDFYFYADGWDKDLSTWYQVSGLLFMMVYSTLSLRAYNSYQKRIFEELSYADTVVYHWMKQFLIALLIIMTMRMLFFFLLPDLGSFGKWFWYYLLFGALYCFIALAGYTNVVKSLAPLNWQRNLKEEPLAEVTTQEETAEELSLLKPKILALMDEERLFENPTLTLNDVAKQLGITSKQVSGLINRGFGQNFNDFVNTYRVKAVKARFARGDQEQFTILSIALECGFNSKTTFNRVFKRLTARTPVQYLVEMSKEDGTTS